RPRTEAQPGCPRPVRTIDLHVAVRDEDEQPRAGEIAGEVEEVVEGAAIGPVEVLQDEEHGLHLGRVAQKSRHRLEEAPAVIFRVAGWPKLHWDPVADLRDDSGDLRGSTAQVLLQSVWVAGEDVASERFHESEIRER